MPQPPQSETPQQYLRTLQIIVSALVMGLIFFAAIVLFVAPAANGRAGGPFGAPICSLVALLVSAMALVARAYVPRVIDAVGRQRILRGGGGAAGDADDRADSSGLDVLLRVYQTRLIVGAALCEGVAFFCLVAFMIERRWFVLAAAIGLILLVASHFPTARRVANWMTQQRQLIDEEQALWARGA